MVQLERELPVEMILFYRQLAESRDRADRAQHGDDHSADTGSITWRALAWVGAFAPAWRQRSSEDVMGEEDSNGPVSLSAAVTGSGEADACQPETALKDYHLDDEQRALLGDLLRQASEGNLAGGEEAKMSVKVSLTLFEMSFTLREKAPAPARVTSSSNASGSSSSNRDSQDHETHAASLWISCELQRLTLDVTMQHGAIDSCTSIDQLRVYDRGSGAVSAPAWCCEASRGDASLW